VAEERRLCVAETSRLVKPKYPANAGVIKRSLELLRIDALAILSHSASRNRPQVFTSGRHGRAK
jgi:hypothetical protein